MTLAVVAGVVVIGAFMVGQVSAKPFVCGVQWDPRPSGAPAPSASGAAAPAASGSPAPAASGDFGFPQPDMGRNHNVSSPQRYAYCPPASGNHHNLSGRGPIQARFYGRSDFTEPAGWVHNLEHGALVVLYRGQEGEPGASGDVQDQLRELWSNLPPSPICEFPRGTIGPVIARFDDMPYPFAALVWNRVLPLDALDTAAIEQFWLAEGEHPTTPEGPSVQCPTKLASPSPSVVVPPPSVAPSVVPSVAPSVAPSPASS